MLDKTREYEYNRTVYKFNGSNWGPVRMVDSSIKFYWSHAQFQYFYDNGQVADYDNSPGETLTCTVRASGFDTPYVWLPYKYKDKTITFTITEVED